MNILRLVDSLRSGKNEVLKNNQNAYNFTYIPRRIVLQASRIDYILVSNNAVNNSQSMETEVMENI